MKTLTVTVGLPRCGKSTWANKQGAPIVNPDSIRLALHGQPFISLAEPFVWAIAKVMVRALFLAGHDRVILDATNITRKRRAEWRSEDWTCEFVSFLDVPLETCLRRVYSGNIDLIAAIQRQHAELEPIGDDE